MSPFVWFLILTGLAALFGLAHEWVKTSVFMAVVIGVIGYALTVTVPWLGWLIMIANPIGSLLTAGGNSPQQIIINLWD